MNKTLLTLGAAMLFAFGSATFTSCGNAEQSNNKESHEHHDEDNDHHHAAAYQCPMQCEGSKTYEEAGKCPKCEMDLEEVGDHHEHGNDEDGHEH